MLYYLITIPLTFVIIRILLNSAKDPDDKFIQFYYPFSVPIMGNVINTAFYHAPSAASGTAIWVICNLMMGIWFVAPHLLASLFVRNKILLHEGAAFGVVAIILANLYGIFSF